MTTGYVHEVNGDVVRFMVPGLNKERPILEIDFHKATVTNLVTSESMSFIQAYPGYGARFNHIVWVPSETKENVNYMVTKVVEDDPRTWTCNCPWFVNRAYEMGEVCKHVGYASTGEYKRIR